MKKLVINTTTILTLLAFLTTQAIADVKGVTFDEALKLALATSPDVARIDATLAARVGDAEETRLGRNPVLDSQVRVPGNRPGSQQEYQVQLLQPLRASDFGFRTGVAAAIRGEAELSKRLALVEFTQTLSLLFTRAWATSERRRSLLTFQSLAKQVLGKVKAGANRGSFPEGDVAVFEGEVALIDSDLLGAEGEQARRLADLTKAIGTDLGGREIQALPILLMPSEQELRERLAAGNVPVQERAKLFRRVATKQLELARLDRIRPITPNLGFQRISDGGQQVTFGIAIELPVFDRNQAQLERAYGADAAARSLEQFSDAGALEEQAALLMRAFSQTRAQIKMFLGRVIPQRERALAGYRKQFDAGQANAFIVWQAQRELMSTKLRYVELAVSERELAVELGILLGEAF